MANKNTLVLDNEVFEEIISLILSFESKEGIVNIDREIATIIDLERAIVDLDVSGKLEYLAIRTEILIRIIYWVKLTKLFFDSSFDEEHPYIEKYLSSDITKKYIFSSLLYSINFLRILARRALKGESNDKLFVDLNAAVPIPSENEKIRLNHSFNFKPDNPFKGINLLLSSYKRRRFNYFTNPHDDEYLNKLKSFVDRIVIKQNSIATNDEVLFRDSLDVFYEELSSNSIISRIPVYIYLDTNDSTASKNIYTLLQQIFSSFNIYPIVDIAAEKGSWIKKLLLRPKKNLTSEELIERLKKFEHGVEITFIEKTQSEINKNNADALSALLLACKDVPKVCLLIGSILIIKDEELDSKSFLLCRTLTTNEAILIKEKPSLLKDPSTLLRLLDSVNKAEKSAQKP